MLEDDAPLRSGPLTGAPPNVTAPELGARKPAIKLSSVVLRSPKRKRDDEFAGLDRHRYAIERDHPFVVIAKTHDDVANFENGHLTTPWRPPGGKRRRRLFTGR